MWLFALFLAVPLIEIALFIQVGGLIGLWPTLAIVIVTAILGTWLMRAQGTMAIGQIQQSFNDLRDPTEPLAHGAMILFAGALLLTPGFFTDAAGFLLLVPPVRRAVFRHLRSRVKVATFSTHTANPEPQDHPTPGNTIDGEYEEITPKKQPTHTASGWTRH